MARSRTSPPRSPSRPPADAGEGAARARALLVKLFDRKDGTGVDWQLLLESLFRAGFEIADKRPDDEARRSLMRRIYTGAYDRAAGSAGAGPMSPAEAHHPTSVALATGIRAHRHQE